jgi:hypothetical protein
MFRPHLSNSADRIAARGATLDVDQSRDAGGG